MKKERQQIRMNTHISERPSPIKFPSVQTIKKTIEGDDGTIFQIDQLLSKANINFSHRSLKSQCKIVNEERKDLQLLTQWIDSMVQQIKMQHFVSITEFYDKLEIIYSGSIGQLCQSLSVKCNDYSLLIDKIWNQFTGTVKEIIEKQSLTNRKLEKDSLVSTMKIHQMYQETLNEKIQRLIEAEKSSKRHSDYAEKINKENRYLRKKNNKLETQLTHITNDLDLLKLQFQDVCKENETLKLFNQVKHVNHVTGIEYEEELYKAKKEIFDDFRIVFEEQTRKFEEAYNNKMQELEINNQTIHQQDEYIQEDYEEILFKDKCVGNHQTTDSKALDTKDLYNYSDMGTQTLIQKKKINDQITQTQSVETISQSIQANFAIIKRECIPRTKEEELLREMSIYPIKTFVDDYYQLYIDKSEINKKTFLDVFSSIIEQLKFRSSQIFNIFKMKEEILLEDFNITDQYVQQSYTVFIFLINDILDFIKQLKEELIARKIQIFEAQIDCKQANRAKNIEEKKLNLLSTKYQLEVKKSLFLIKQIKTISPHVPQFLQDQIRRKALKHKITLEFLKTRNTLNVLNSSNQLIASNGALTSHNLPVNSSQNLPPSTINNGAPLQLQSQSTLQTLLPPQHQSTLPSLQQPYINPQQSYGFFPIENEINAPQRKSLVELSSETPEVMSPQKPLITLIFPDQQFDDSTSTSEEEIDLQEIVNPIKSLLSIEKKLFVNRCPSKNTQIATQTLLSEIQNFRRDKIDNIVTQATLIKVLSQFISWCIKYNKPNYPMHVLLYEYFSSENQSQPQNVWLGKVARVVKSLIYFKKKNDTARLFHFMLIGDLSFQIYLTVLSNIQNKDFSETGISVLQSNLAENVPGVQRSAQYLDYDQEILLKLPEMQKDKNQTIQSKYSLILSLFDNNKFTLNQFRLLLLELEPEKTEQQIINLFNSECDIEQLSVQYMTFQRFAVLCDELKLLTHIPHYIEQNNTQYFREIELWKHREIDLKLMLIRSYNYDASERDLFNKMNSLTQLDQRIILGRLLERRAKELLIQRYAIECLAPFMLMFEQ